MTKKRAKVLRKLNNLNEIKMSKDSNEVYTDMVIYLRFSNLTLLQQELVRSDLIQMIIDGEERGENIQQILGGDYKTMCDEIISTFPPMSKKDKILNFISISSLSFSIILLIFVGSQVLTNLIDNTEMGTVDFMASYLVIFPLSLVVAWVFAKKISKTSVRTPKLNKKKELTKIWLFFSIFLGVTVTVQSFLDQVLFQTTLVVMIAVIALLFITHFLLESKTEY